MKINTIIKPEYLWQTNKNPKYIFHGSSQLILTDIEPKQGHDDVGYRINEQKAIYGTAIFKGAIPYAIGKGKVSCSIGDREDNLAMKIYSGTIPDDSYGYIYVLDSEKFKQCNNTCQYVSFANVKPIEVIKVQYRDFKDCFVDKTKYELINTPYELSTYMHFNIAYKWMDQAGELHDELGPMMDTEYSLMTPQEVLENQCGICVDQVELERDWFEKHNYQYEVLNIQIFRENDAPGHVFLIYFENGKWRWFENAWSTYKGIHSYATREDLIEAIKYRFIVQNNILEQELDNLKVDTFPKYPSHFSYEQMEDYDNNKIK